MNISNRPCQFRSTNYWADDVLRNSKQRFLPSDSNKNVDIKFIAYDAFLE